MNTAILKGILKYKNISVSEIGEKFGMTIQSFSNKLNSCESRFSMRDLIKFASLTNCRVVIIDEDGREHELK